MDHPLRTARIARHLTQRELAEKAGVDPSTIAKIETRERFGDIKTWRRLGKTLGVDYRMLLEQ